MTATCLEQAPARGLVLCLADRDDIPALVSLHERCSSTTLWYRYLALPPRDLTRFLGRLLETSQTYLAIDGQDVVGMANLAVSSGVAEIALLVEDGCQGRGTGKAMARSLAELAADAGANRLVACSFADNIRLRRTLAAAGLSFTTSFSDGLAELTVDLRS